MEEGRGRKWLVERDENSLRSAPDRKGEGGGLLASYQNMPEPYSTVLYCESASHFTSTTRVGGNKSEPTLDLQEVKWR